MSSQERSSLNTFENVLVRIGGTVAEICLFVLVSLIVVDVFLRYVFNAPTKFTDEVGGYLLVGISFMGATYALKHGSHVKVTVLTERFPQKVQRWFNFITESLALSGLIILVWKTVQLVMRSYATNFRSMGYLEAPMWLPQLVVPIGLTIFSLHILLLLIVQARRLSTGPKEMPKAPSTPQQPGEEIFSKE